ncbi:MAG: VanZ family protein [Lysobacter sp.]|nr:VanZ family protein [Lysobacter sp.]
MAPVIKPFHRPRLWLGAWLLLVAIVIVLSLTPPPPLPPLPSGTDKVEHFLAYFVLAAGAVQGFAARRTQFSIGVGLIALGALLEVAQASLTVTRMMDLHDAIANALGVLVGLITTVSSWHDFALRLDQRRRGNL